MVQEFGVTKLLMCKAEISRNRENIIAVVLLNSAKKKKKRKERNETK